MYGIFKFSLAVDVLLGNFGHGVGNDVAAVFDVVEFHVVEELGQSYYRNQKSVREKRETMKQELTKFLWHFLLFARKRQGAGMGIVTSSSQKLLTFSWGFLLFHNCCNLWKVSHLWFWPARSSLSRPLSFPTSLLFTWERRLIHGGL